jgi:ubiquinone/menaquinone biosynthesis C-methylase UbiE
MKNDKKTPDYGNWVPNKMFYLLGFVVAAFVLLTIFIPVMVLKLVFLIGFIIFSATFAYFYKSYCVFSYKGGRLSGKILDMILSYLAWNGKGTILDIGCGSGALVIKLAKKYLEAKIIGIDYWGVEWSYNKEQCQQNAALERVSDRIEFLNGSASKLPFENESFDAVVSNFTFHEVKDTKNKRDVIKEALRIVKKGGIFVFHDLFYIKSLYGDPEGMLMELRKLNITEINIINTSNLEIIPKFLRTSFMLGGIGLIYGKK